MSADPKPRKRYRASKAEWGQIRAAFCTERCFLCAKPWESLHHVVPRSKGGDDWCENLVALCGDGTRGCHGLVEAREQEALHALRRALKPMQRAYVCYRLGPGWEEWLDRRYPVLTEVAA